MLAPAFLEVARLLASRGRGRPRQADRRRAASTACFAMFQCLAHCCANRLAGSRITRSGGALSRTNPTCSAFTEFERRLSTSLRSQPEPPCHDPEGAPGRSRIPAARLLDRSAEATGLPPASADLIRASGSPASPSAGWIATGA